VPETRAIFRRGNRGYRADPDQIVFGPIGIKWRIDDPELSNLM